MLKNIIEDISTTNIVKLLMDVFSSVDGFETFTEFMKKRALLEYSILKNIINGKHELALNEIIKDTGISHRDPDLHFLLESMVQNNKITFHHQDLFTMHITDTLHLNCFIDCEPAVVNEILTKLGYENTNSFECAKKEHIESITAEINEKMKIMKKFLK